LSNFFEENKNVTSIFYEVTSEEKTIFFSEISLLEKQMFCF